MPQIEMTGNGNVAEHFSLYDKDNLPLLILQAPYEPPGRNAAWVRGGIRVKPEGSSYAKDFVITGPRMRVCYGGCRWNRLVLALPGAGDPAVYKFERWIREVCKTVRSGIWANPSKFKPGASSNTRFVFDDNVIRPSTDAVMYPDELLTKLSVKRVNGEDEEVQEIVDAELFMDGPDGPIPVNAEDITNGSEVIPIIKISYFRNNERFGLTLTVLKAKVFMNEGTRRVENGNWVFDEMDQTN